MLKFKFFKKKDNPKLKTQNTYIAVVTPYCDYFRDWVHDNFPPGVRVRLRNMNTVTINGVTYKRISHPHDVRGLRFDNFLMYRTCEMNPTFLNECISEIQSRILI